MSTGGDDTWAGSWSGPTIGGQEAPAAAPGSSLELPDRYEVLDLVGVGGMGRVHRVADRRVSQELVCKVQRLEQAGSPAARARFLREPTLTARLRHPAVVSIHDLGELPDGRVWFTMDEVRGDTLSEVIAARPVVPLRRLVDTLAQVAAAVASAHEAGVLHRDLKPDNVMVGAFGEVRVMDWGLGLDLAELDPGDTSEIVGTPGFMAPEQARGEGVGPPADVHALGAMLYEILCGAPPFHDQPGDRLRQSQRGRPTPAAELPPRPGQPLPDELTTLCDAALCRDPAGRPTAAALATELTAWMDGARRRDRALALVAKADRLLPSVRSHRAEVKSLRDKAAELLDALPVYAPAADKRPAWALEDAAAHVVHTALELQSAWLQQLHTALQLVPQLPEAHARLADHWAEQLLEAERRHDEEAVVRAETQLRAHDRGQHALLLEGKATLVLDSEPSGAELSWQPLREAGRRLEPGPAVALGVTPVQVELPHGSGVIVLSHAGRPPLHLPLLLERGATWTHAPPGAGARPVALWNLDQLGPGECLVPEGWFQAGGDPHAVEALPATRAWVHGFVIQRDPVTVGRYREFLEDLVEKGRSADALRWSPQHRPARADAVVPVVSLQDEGAVRFPDGPVWAEEVPVVQVDWHSARAYAAWLAQRDGLPWRLPHELEWEKAARGVDGRACPWGDHVEATWANVLDSHPGTPARCSVNDWPTDVSVYGVRGLAGNVRDWCSNVWTRTGPELDSGELRPDTLAGHAQEGPFRVARGGAWLASPIQSRSAARFANPPDRRFTSLGFRLVRSI